MIDVHGYRAVVPSEPVRSDRKEPAKTDVDFQAITVVPTSRP
jgi:hypothetical protein